MKPLPHLGLAASIWLLILLAACSGPQTTAGAIEIEVEAEGNVSRHQVPAGSTVAQALESAGLSLGALDRTDPPSYTVLTEGTRVEITRVREGFEIEEVVIPFERQTVRNEGLPVGDTRLLQAGANGREEITYRIVEEGGEQVSRTPVQRTVIEPAQPEIVMVGAQASFTPIPITGRLVYLASGNAWLMEANSGNRRPIVVSGDLDGRVFDLSPGGEYLLYTRAAPEDSESINSLWAISLEAEAEPIDLQAENVVHFAAWSPEEETLQLAYSTVEPSPAAPGWQANNDLVLATLSAGGRLLDSDTLIAPNAGGQYGWWGTDFAWAPDGIHLAVARADAIGVVDLREPTVEIQIEVTPFQTLSDWAWVPGVAWGNDSRTLFYVGHGESIGLEQPTASPVFNLNVLAPAGGGPLILGQRTGMFAQPSASPPVVQDSGEISTRIAYLQALSPLESQDSSYRLELLDRDGSNRQSLFPAPGQPGLRGDDLQQPPAWSPDGQRLALSYAGDLWIIDAASGRAQQVTGDGATAAYDWESG